MPQKKALILGAGGFIGGHLTNKLKAEGCWVRGIDLKQNEFQTVNADEFIIGDLREKKFVEEVIDQDFDELYQLAADMGGAGYLFTGEHDADVIHNSALINLHVAKESVLKKVKKIFFSSSACIYPQNIQNKTGSNALKEEMAVPADPDSDYGWEKLFGEKMYLAFNRNYNLNIRIARFHNIYGPFGTWKDGKEKAPAAICRKVAETNDGGEIEIWGDGKQTRSFLFIDECLEGVNKLMESNFMGPVNIGSNELVTIEQLAQYIIRISGKKINIKYVNGPVGVLGRNSDNTLIKDKLDWAPKKPLYAGLKKTYEWVEEQVINQIKVATVHDN